MAPSKAHGEAGATADAVVAGDRDDRALRLGVEQGLPQHGRIQGVQREVLDVGGHPG
ncbi:hypothetical protein [Vulcanococcus limneticus]|uniref:hypothetical protein n=1 Tax=Vulcanococcus limneticus TaxID=2170428 RepID=UPI00398BF428